MNEFPRLNARLEKSERAVEANEDRVRKLENMIIRLAEQINLMQQQRKPGRKPKPNEAI